MAVDRVVVFLFALYRSFLNRSFIVNRGNGKNCVTVTAAGSGSEPFAKPVRGVQL